MTIVIISDWDQKLKATPGFHIAKRIYDARAESGIENVEVFLFASGGKLLQVTPPEADQLLNELKQSNSFSLHKWNKFMET